MRLLLMGGGWFLGRAVAEAARGRGWEVTTFSRGQSPVPSGTSHVRGDRTTTEGLAELARAGAWDATIDTSAYEPPDVANLLTAVGSDVGQYVLVSTVSAYRDWPESPVNEQSPLWPADATWTASSADLAAMPEPHRYGSLKASCEAAATQLSPRVLIVRPGVILGPGEYVGRGLSLTRRAERGGRWLLPAPAVQLIQPVDVRDVACFLLDAIAAGRTGAYNLVAPPGHATYGQLIEAFLKTTGRRSVPVWADPQWLLQQGVGQWTEIPLWRTPAGTWGVDGRRAADAGLRCRPLEQTVTDFVSAFRRDGLMPHERQLEHGLTSAREAELLAAWDEHQSALGTA